MAMTLSLLRTASYLLFLLAAAVVLKPVGQYIAPVLLVGLLLAHVVSIPYWVAWSRSYRHLLLDAVLIIAVTVVMYGFLFFRLGMDGASPALSLMEAMQYSLGVWVGVPF